MSWDPTTYLGFADHRTRPAAELLARIDMTSPARVADLGCGPGNSTALLAARWPEAAVHGVDSSPEMIERASGAGLKAAFSVGDIAGWSAEAPYDVIFSNAALHWLDGHDALLPRLMSQLSKGGVLAVQMPANFLAPSHILLEEAVRETGSKDLIARLRGNPVSPMAEYHRILAPHAATLDIWETTYLQVLTGNDAVLQWTSGTALVPFVSELAGQQRDDFVDAYRGKLAAAYPQRADGTTLFPFTRLFMVARCA